MSCLLSLLVVFVVMIFVVVVFVLLLVLLFLDVFLSAPGLPPQPGQGHTVWS